MSDRQSSSPAPANPRPPLSLSPWAEGAILAAILLAGAGARLAHLHHLASLPDYDAPVVDAAFHDYWARGLSEDRWPEPPSGEDPRISESPYFRPPGYPYFLAGIYGVTGGSYLAPRLLQFALGLVSAVLAWWLLRRPMGQAAGLLAAAGMSLYWSLIYFEGELHAPALLISLTLGSLCLRSFNGARGGWLAAAGAGLLAGLAVLVRPNALVFVPLLVLWGWWLARRRGRPVQGLAGTATLALAAGAAILPAAIRNYVVSGEVVPVTANAGVNLYIGNNPRATGRCIADLGEAGRFGTCFDYPEVLRNIGGASGPATYLEADRYFRERAMAWIRENPGRFAELLGTKAALFWGPTEVGHNKEVAFERCDSPVLSLLPGSWPAVLALGVMGLVGALAVGGGRSARPEGYPSGRELTILLATMAVVYFLSVWPFFVAARYRVPITPLLICLAACGPVAMAGWLRRGRFLAAGSWVVAAAGLYLLASLPLTDYTPSLGRWHCDRADLYTARGDRAPAARHYRAAFDDEVWSDYAARGLGASLLRLGRYEEAVEPLRRAAEAEPEPPLLINLGLALYRTDRRAEAARQWARAAELAPEMAEAQKYLGIARLDAGDLAAARRRLRRAAELAPADADTHFLLGESLFLQRRYREAIASYEEAFRLNPRHGGAAGRLVEARRRLKTAGGSE
jgi:Flp pilus assembly protein TadD/4-amino-4-deoxy-L-arabinose transferase-like glycosyltransferase